MPKILKNIFLMFLLMGFIGFLTLGYYSKEPDEVVLAQEFGALECNGPIVPNGAVSEEIIRLVNVVFKQYQLSAGYLQSAINHAQGLIVALTQTENVCDFSKCGAEMTNNKPGEVSNVAPDFSLMLNAYVVKGEVGIRPGLCTDREGVGDPCSIKDIRSSVEHLDFLTSAFKGSYGEIHRVFSTKSESATEDTRIKANDYLERTEESVGELMTKQEEIKRKLEAVEGLIELCSLSELERKMAEQGRMGERKLKKCIDALRDGTYEHPEPWSEACENECSVGPSEECIECLGECEGTSILSKLNCRIYSEKTGANTPENCSNGEDASCCGSVCKDDYDSPACDDCLCAGLSREECNAWLCGGHFHNWICCSAVPID